MAVEYSKKTNAELIEILKSRSLPHTGKKADLVARLQEADNATTTDDPSKPVASAGNAGSGKTDAAVADDVIDWDDDAAVDNPPAETAPATTTTDESKAPEPEAQEETEPAEAVGDEKQQNGEEIDEQAPESAEEETKPAPAVDYSMGLGATDVDAEIAKRKARAEKFGISSETASTETQKAAERAKRFGAEAQGGTGGVKGLDEALSSERPRKRGRGDDGDGYRGGKRRDSSGRGRGRFGGGRQPRRNDNNEGGGEQKNGLSQQERDAMEKRRQRFG